jgi:integrase
VRSMARKKTLIKTGLIEYLGMTFDYGGDVDKELSALVKAKELDIFPQTEKHKKPEIVSEIIFSVLFENFLAHKMDTVIARKEGRNPLTEKIQKQYHRDFTILIEIMGDIPISSITRKMLEGSILTFGELPKRNIKPYNKMPIVELLEMEIPDDHRVSSKVPDEVRRLVQGIFRYALDQEFIQVSPARDLNLKLTSSRTFASYSKNEIVSLLLACGKEDDMSWKRWIPFLAAYTGARLGELVQLRKKDVRFDSDSGRHYLFITDDAGKVKNENAIRQVPLHKELIDAGFLDLIASANDRLFESLKREAVTAWFARLRVGLMIEGCDDYGNRKVFHSFRHTFITQSLSAGSNPLHLQQVVGHERINTGTTGRYTHEFPLSAILDVVDKVSYL